MKRLLPALLALLLAAGCAASAEMDAPSTEPDASVPITADSLRTEYEAEGFIVREIVPYEGDFLVYYGTEPYNGGFQWVYADTLLLLTLTKLTAQYTVESGQLPKNESRPCLRLALRETQDW